MAILGAGTVVYGADWAVWTFITDNYVAILTTNILISYFLATYVYVRSFSVKHPKDPGMRELAAGGHSGNILYDWFIGRELNPALCFPSLARSTSKHGASCARACWAGSSWILPSS